MNIKNTYSDIPSAFENNCFSIEKWKSYIDACIPGAKELCIADIQDRLNNGYIWQDKYLPILNAVITNSCKRKEALKSFNLVTKNLDKQITNAFGKTVHADVILYIGLCNGAGWVTQINGTPTVLLGLEKILELGWYTADDMTGLIVHELGHIYHCQYGSYYEKTNTLAEKFLWQLFTEGIAMVFEQTVIGNDEYFHQDKNGWKNWCDCHAEWIKQSFYRDLNTITHENQRYFGDWVNLEGYGDTGYYLGALFVRYLLQFDCFDNVIQYNLETVKEKYNDFMKLSQ